MDRLLTDKEIEDACEEERWYCFHVGYCEYITPLRNVAARADIKSIQHDRRAMAEWMDDWYRSSHDDIGDGAISWQDIYDRTVDMLYKGKAPWDES